MKGVYMVWWTQKIITTLQFSIQTKFENFWGHNWKRFSSQDVQLKVVHISI
jgi:hypothetical protein